MTTIPTAGQRSSPIAIVPSCPNGKIFVSVHNIRANETDDWQYIIDASPESVNIGYGFAGTVAAIGRDVMNKGFKVNNAVYGHIAKGLWIDTLGFVIESAWVHSKIEEYNDHD
ncbi:hypothetical protein FRB95_005888 [Tulasnella sp. JGI-2019a]|nr:hypothetical protein FRB95_005888 [Tulasnella sp. JGI-2019a]